MVESMLRSAGYSTGLFTSPHLCDVRERVRINGYAACTAGNRLDVGLQARSSRQYSLQARRSWHASKAGWHLQQGGVLQLLQYKLSIMGAQGLVCCALATQSPH
jgi:hypothetical protein